MHNYRLEIIDKHAILVLEDGKIFILDTGSPFTISNGSFGFCGRVCQGNSSMLSMIRDLSSLDVDGLIGLDTMRGLNVMFDYPNGEVVFSSEDFELGQTTVPLNKILGSALVFNAEINNNSVRCILDTGAKLSYVKPAFVSAQEPVDTEEDFYPGIGKFNSNVYDVPVSIGGQTINARMGVLPQGTMIAQTVYMLADAVVGYDLFKDRKVALFHDFGKAVRRSREYGYAEHPKRSLAILDKLGLNLNDRERDAIGNHHNYKSTRGIFGYMANPLRLSLSLGDCKSTGEWKKAHAG